MIKPVMEKPVDARVLRKSTASENESARGKYFMPAEEEKASVLEIISDLEKQLESAFSIKDEQAKEIADLQKELETYGQRNALLEARLKELQGVMVAQEKLSFNLEFLENERLASTQQIHALEVELEQRSKEKGDLILKMEETAREIQARENRLEQMETELNSAHATIQNFQNQIHVAQEKQEALRRKLEETVVEVRNTLAEKEECERQLEQAKGDLDEIRLMLSDTRAKAREHNLKKKN